MKIKKFKQINYEPLHVQIEKQLLDKINTGELKPLEYLPPERKLSNMFDVSRKTLRIAFLNLKRKGIIQQKQGKGTYVSPKEFLSEYKHIKTNNISFITSLDDSYLGTDPFFIGILNGIQDIIQKTKYHLIFERDINTERIKLLKEKSDAVILLHYRSETLIKKLKQENLPCIQIGSSVNENLQCSCIIRDFKQCVFQSLKYLNGLGHRKISVLRMPDETYAGYQTKIALEQSFKELSLNMYPELIKTVTVFEFEKIYKTINGIFSGSVLPTAVFLLQDAYINPLLKVLEEKKLRIPEDISVIGGEGVKPLNHQLLLSTSRLITTMITPVRKIGQLAVKKMEQYLSDGYKYEIIKVKHNFIDRETCGKTK